MHYKLPVVCIFSQFMSFDSIVEGTYYVQMSLAYFQGDRNLCQSSVKIRFKRLARVESVLVGSVLLKIS